jgi:hypothetical protein
LKFSLSFYDIKINLDINAQEVVTFLKAYFVPFFDWKEEFNENADCLITVKVCDPILKSDFINISEFIVDDSKGFLAMKGQSVNFGSFPCIKLNPMNVLVTVNNKQHEIVIEGNTEDRLKTPVLRVIEDFTLIEVEKRGGIVLHASGIVVDSNAVIAVGNKGAGKSSLLCTSLDEFECDKISNDNIVLVLVNNEIIVRGWPSFAKLAMGTIASSRILAPYFPKEKLSLLESTNALWNEYEKVIFYPSQICEIFGSSIVPEARLTTLLFPNYSTTDIGNFKLADRRDLMNLLKKNLQGSFNTKHQNWLQINKVDKKQVLESLDKIFPILEKQVVCFHVDWGKSLAQLFLEFDIMRKVNKAFIKCSVAAPRNKWPSLPAIYEM